MNVIVTFAAIASGGSLRSWSVTPRGGDRERARLAAHESRSGLRRERRRAAGHVAVLAPLDEQGACTRAATFTGSLKVTARRRVERDVGRSVRRADLAHGRRASAPCGTPAVCAPSPRKVLLAKPSHSTAGSKASVPSGRRSQISALRRSVLSPCW